MLTGLVMGFFTYVSMAMTFVKLPKKIKKYILRHELLSDLIAGAIIWGIVGLMSKTIAGLFAAIVAEILAAFSLHLYADYFEKQEEQLPKRSKRKRFATVPVVRTYVSSN